MPQKPKKVSTYPQEEHSTPSSDKPSGDIEEDTNLDESTQIETEDASHIDKVPSINCEVKAHDTYRFSHCLDVVNAEFPFQSSSGKAVGIFLEYDYLKVFKTQVDDKSIKVREQAAADRGKGTRLVALNKPVHVVNFNVNSGVDKIIYLTTQEHLQHAWDITFQLQIPH